MRRGGGFPATRRTAIAVASDGTLYLATYAGNGYASATALIEVRPDGQSRVIWQS